MKVDPRMIKMTHDGVTRDLDLDSMKMRESLECEQKTRLTWSEWREELVRDGALSVTFAWWLAGQRADVDDENFSTLLDTLDQAKISFAVVDVDEEVAPEVEPEDVGPTSPGDLDAPEPPTT